MLSNSKEFGKNILYVYFSFPLRRAKTNDMTGSLLQSKLLTQQKFTL